MLSHKDFKTKVLVDPEVLAEYERLQPEMGLLDLLLSARMEAACGKQLIVEARNVDNPTHA